MCYCSFMPRSVEAGRKDARRRTAALRSHYRQHRVDRDGYWYNPLLDDPDHPENTRHWRHGTVEGYQDAGCHCPGCGPVGRAENERKRQARIDRCLSEHRSAAAAMALVHVPDLSGATAADIAEVVVATHRVANRWRAKVAYELVPVELALKNWELVSGRQLGPGVRAELGRRLVEELSR